MFIWKLFHFFSYKSALYYFLKKNKLSIFPFDIDATQRLFLWFIWNLRTVQALDHNDDDQSQQKHGPESVFLVGEKWKSAHPAWLGPHSHARAALTAEHVWLERPQKAAQALKESCPQQSQSKNLTIWE